MTGPEIATPNIGRPIIGGCHGPGNRDRGIHIGLGWKMIADDAFIPTRIVPSFVVAAIRSLSGRRKALFCTHNAVGRAIKDIGKPTSGPLTRPADESSATSHVPIIFGSSLVAPWA